MAGADIDAMIEHFDLSSRISYFPFLEDTANLYAAGDSLVFPAENEPFGLYLIEAMVMALPVIAVKSGATSELIQHESTGLLVNPGRSEELASAMARVISDKKLRSRLGVAGREYVQRMHRATAYAEVIMQLFDSVLAKRRA